MFFLFLLRSKHIKILLLLLLRNAVGADNDRVISFVRFQSQLLFRFEAILLQLFDLSGEHSFRRRRGIDTTRFNTDDEVTALFQEVLGVQSDNSRLIWLRNICENSINHTN